MKERNDIKIEEVSERKALDEGMTENRQKAVDEGTTANRRKAEDSRKPAVQRILVEERNMGNGEMTTNGQNETKGSKNIWNKLERYIPKAKREVLLMIAGLVWLAAGINIVRMGALGLLSASFFLPLMAAGALTVFLLFFLLIFRRLVGKHTRRILAYQEKKIAILRFFDGKSYLIMAFMMTFGILLRTSGLLPGDCIGSIYIGLGAALMTAGLGFMSQYIKTLRIRAEA